MDFWQHLKASSALELQGTTEGLASRFSELISRGHSVADLLAHYGDDFGHLPAERLRAMAQAHRVWLLWRKRKAQLCEAREKAGLEPIPEDVFREAPEPHQLDAIIRTARLCPRSDVASLEEWLAVLRVGVELWTRCLALARKHGKVACLARDLEHPDGGAYDAYIRRTEELEGLVAHRWLAMRRGERAGVLALDVTVPAEPMLEEVKRLQSTLGPVAAERTPESLLQELVLADLPPWLLRQLDTESQWLAIRGATEALAGLLRSAPVQVRQLGAVHISRPRGSVGLVIADREGDPVAQRLLRAEGPWLDKVLAFFEESRVQQVVLPTTAVAADLLAALEARLNGAELQTIKIRSAALAEARLPLTDPPMRLGPAVASALVLARRALDPMKEWSLVDPVAIGVAEYQNDLDPDQLRAALVETAELCRLERRRGKRVYLGGPTARGNSAMARLNPLVKSLADLRAGMSVHGVVTNISHFGAFVNIGLSQEALVHISELSDRFVSNPNEVVSIGQQVTAHVLAVDPGRGRISLSLKTRRRTSAEREERPGNAGGAVSWSPREGSSSARRGGGGSTIGAGNGGGGASSSPMTRAQALANLEKLFKK